MLNVYSLTTRLFRVRNKLQESTEKKRKNALKKVAENRRVREVWYKYQ